MCVYILVSPVSVAVLVAFCGASYLEVVKSREDQVPTKGDFLAALLPLVCIPALLSLCSGWLKWLVNFFFSKIRNQIQYQPFSDVCLSWCLIVCRFNLILTPFAGRMMIGNFPVVYMYLLQLV